MTHRSFTTTTTKLQSTARNTLT